MKKNIALDVIGNTLLISFKNEILLPKADLLYPDGSTKDKVTLAVIAKEHPGLAIATVLPDRAERCFSTGLL